MVIKCGNCDQDMEVEDTIANGAHVRCPFCGETTAYSRPSRIALPTGGGAGARSFVRNAPANEPPPEQPRKPLRVIRPQAGAAPQENHIYDHRKIRMAEDHLRFFEGLKDQERRRKQIDKITNTVVILLLVVGIFGSVFWMRHRKEMRHQAELARQAEQIRLDAQRAEQEREERARREAEEKERREKRLVEEKERQKKLEAEERERRERRLAEEEKARAERIAKENAVLAEKALYKEAVALFRNGEFAFADALPKDKTLGKCEGEFFCIRPFLENGEIIVFKSTEQGIASVCRLSESGVRTPLENDGFLTSLDGKDSLIATDGKVYFRSKRKKPHVGQIKKDAVVDLVGEFFGDVADEARLLGIVPDNLSFEIVFIPQGSKNVIISEVVEAGVAYSLEKVRDAVEEAFPMKAKKASSGSRNGKRFKRTVVLWDGAVIKKGIDGVTFVPRVAPSAASAASRYSSRRGTDWYYYDNDYAKASAKAGHTRAHWQALYDEAVRQEEQEREHNERMAQARAGKDEREYARRIDRIIDDGALYFRAKFKSADK